MKSRQNTAFRPFEAPSATARTRRRRRRSPPRRSTGARLEGRCDSAAQSRAPHRGSAGPTSDKTPRDGRGRHRSPTTA
ncbi:MAG: hypothetical protein FJW21_03930 [Acidimicrobiia bacterium]|nr:hypothetical protein [Acidimicrobiia bacterium]